jgi:acetoin utilization deacetylase AcuC-like enzyme
MAAAVDVVAPDPATREDLLRVHTPAYVDDFLNARVTPRTYRSEMALDPAIVRAFVLGTGGTIRATREALTRSRPGDPGAAVNLGGGLHHAYPDHAEGFCYLNDVAIAIRRAQVDGLLRRTAVVDCDVHQGNGTAVIFDGDRDVVTFSIHQENNYPMKERSDLDIGLPDFTDDGRYQAELLRGLRLLEARGPFDAVFYLAGADPFAGDRLGGLALTLDGLRERDRTVISWTHAMGAALVVTLAGGYAERLEDTVAIHAATIEEVVAAWESPGAAER